jgi:peptidoglycan/LPS O-acetylase OafA/YrhL
VGKGPVDEPVPAIDGFRAIAATLVVVYHSWLLTGLAPLGRGPVRGVLAGGWVGVDLFFILSGFVLFLPVARRGSIGSLRSYAVRRAARIIPAYYLCLALVITVFPLVGIAHSAMPWSNWSGVATLVGHLAFVQSPMFGLSGRTGFGIDQVLWTISLEALFYVALPIVAAPFLRRPTRWLVGSIIVAGAWKAGVVWLAHGDDRFGFRWGTQFPSYVGHFALGMACACFFAQLRSRQREKLERWAPLVQVATLAGVLLLMYNLGSRDLGTRHSFRYTANLPIAVAFAGLLLATILSSPAWQRPFLNPAVRFVGMASYGMYLFHDLIIGFWLRHGINPAGSNSAFFKMMSVALPAAMFAGWASFRFVEQPIRARARARAVTVMTPPPRSAAAAAR